MYRVPVNRRINDQNINRLLAKSELKACRQAQFTGHAIRTRLRQLDKQINVASLRLIVQA